MGGHGPEIGRGEEREQGIVGCPKRVGAGSQWRKSSSEARRPECALYTAREPQAGEQRRDCAPPCGGGEGLQLQGRARAFGDVWNFSVILGTVPGCTWSVRVCGLMSLCALAQWSLGAQVAIAQACGTYPAPCHGRHL